MTSHFLEMLERAKEIHVRKNQDYTTDRNVNPYENFDRSNTIASWFPDSYKSFAVLIGTKLARLGALLTQKRKPNNEALDDTFLDLVVYCILFYCFWKERTVGVPQQEVFVYKGIKCTCGAMDPRDTHAQNCPITEELFRERNPFKTS